MQLHLLNRSPNHTSWREACLAVADYDAVVLMQDAVYALIELTPLHFLQAKGAICYVLKDDAIQRGVRSLPENVQYIDSQALVKLSLQAHHCISWH